MLGQGAPGNHNMQNMVNSGSEGMVGNNYNNMGIMQGNKLEMGGIN